MYFGAVPPQEGSIRLQATLAAASAFGESMQPHHPITCSLGDLQLHEDGSLECDHVRTPAADQRTQDCVQATAAILLFEMAFEKFGFTPRLEST